MYNTLLAKGLNRRVEVIKMLLDATASEECNIRIGLAELPDIDGSVEQTDNDDHFALEICGPNSGEEGIILITETGGILTPEANDLIGEMVYAVLCSQGLEEGQQKLHGLKEKGG